MHKRCLRAFHSKLQTNQCVVFIFGNRTSYCSWSTPEDAAHVSIATGFWSNWNQSQHIRSVFCVLTKEKPTDIEYIRSILETMERCGDGEVEVAETRYLCTASLNQCPTEMTSRHWRIDRPVCVVPQSCELCHAIAPIMYLYNIYKLLKLFLSSPHLFKNSSPKTLKDLLHAARSCSFLKKNVYVAEHVDSSCIFNLYSKLK